MVAEKFLSSLSFKNNFYFLHVIHVQTLVSQFFFFFLTVVWCHLQIPPLCGSHLADCPTVITHKTTICTCFLQVLLSARAQKHVPSYVPTTVEIMFAEQRNVPQENETSNSKGNNYTNAYHKDCCQLLYTGIHYVQTPHPKSFEQYSEELGHCGHNQQFEQHGWCAQGPHHNETG